MQLVVQLGDHQLDGLANLGWTGSGEASARRIAEPPGPNVDRQGNSRVSRSSSTSRPHSGALMQAPIVTITLLNEGGGVSTTRTGRRPRGQAYPQRDPRTVGERELTAASMTRCFGQPGRATGATSPFKETSTLLIPVRRRTMTQHDTSAVDCDDLDVSTAPFFSPPTGTHRTPTIATSSIDGGGSLMRACPEQLRQRRGLRICQRSHEAGREPSSRLSPRCSTSPSV